jgi:hypothetical protein
MQLSDWLYATAGRKHGIALRDLLELLFTWMTREVRLAPEIVAPALWQDYQRGGRSDLPEVLRSYVSPADTRKLRPPEGSSPLPPRQRRHVLPPK